MDGPANSPDEFLFDDSPSTGPLASRWTWARSTESVAAYSKAFIRHGRSPIGPSIRKAARWSSFEFPALTASSWPNTTWRLSSRDALFVGPIRLQLQCAVSDRMRDDFFTADLAKLPSDGLLLAYYRDEVVQIDVKEKIGRRIPRGTDGAGVEVVEYLPYAQPDRLGRFVTKSQEPGNPLVELRVDLPGEPTSLRQIASAKEPLLSLDSVFQRDCPVKFRFYHPAVKLPPTIEFLQAADGQLYSCACSPTELLNQGNRGLESEGKASPGF